MLLPITELTVGRFRTRRSRRRARRAEVVVGVELAVVPGGGGRSSGVRASSSTITGYPERRRAARRCRLFGSDEAEISREPSSPCVISYLSIYAELISLRLRTCPCCP